MKSKLPFIALAGLTGIVLALLVSPLTPKPNRGVQEVLLPLAEAQQGELSIAGLAQLNGVPAYWLGESYQSLALVDIQHKWDPGSPDGFRTPRESVIVIYSSCKPGLPPSGNPTEGYCTSEEFPPTYVSVRSEWLCLRLPSVLAANRRSGPPVNLRGAALAQQTTAGNVRVYFGNSTATVFASEGEEATWVAAKALRGVNLPGKSQVANEHVPLGPPREEDCVGFILPTPQPTATPESTATPTTDTEPTTTPGG